MTIQAAPACGRGLLRPMDGSGEIRAGFYYIKFEGGFQWGIFFLMSAWDAGRRWRLAEIKSTRAQISCLCTRVLV